MQRNFCDKCGKEIFRNNISGKFNRVCFMKDSFQADKSYKEDGKWYDDLYEKIIAMFSLVQVKEGSDYHCINGFTEELLEQSKIDLNW